MASTATWPDTAELLIPLRRGGSGIRYLLSGVEITSFANSGSDDLPRYTISVGYRQRAFSDTPR
jgi:hypothetical protein